MPAKDNKLTDTDRFALALSPIAGAAPLGLIQVRSLPGPQALGPGTPSSWSGKSTKIGATRRGNGQ